MDLEKKVVELDLNDILPNRFQPRIKFNEESILELSKSIKEHGVIQPIVVRPVGDKYEIIAGERRFKASLVAGKKVIPAIISHFDDRESSEVALIENVQRKDLTAIEEAISYKKILDMGHITQEELAGKVGKSQSTIANKIRLLNLDDEVQEALLEEKISERHARSLLKLTDITRQKEMLGTIIANRLTVRTTDNAIAEMLKNESAKQKAPRKEEPVIIEEKIVNMEKRNDNMQIFDPFNIGASEPSVEETPSVPEMAPVPEEVSIPSIVPSLEEVPPVVGETPTIPPIVQPLEEIAPVTEEVSIPLDAPVEQSIEGIPPIAEEIQIPIAPIEENTSALEESVTPDFSFNEIPQETGINPGFMDLDKIENEAADINIERPMADVGSLLNPVPEEMLPVAEEVQPMPEVEMSVEPVSAPVSTPVEGENKFFSFPTTEKKEESVPAPNLSDNPFNFKMEQPTSEVLQAPAAPPPNPFGLDFAPSTPAPAPVEEKTSDFLNPNYDFNVSAPVVREEINFNDNLMSVPPIAEVQPNAQTVAPMTSTISDAIAIIKDCETNIRNLGFNVRIEETDLENSYNINIRIEK